MNKTNWPIIVAGIGPGSPDDITPAVRKAIGDADVVVGYKYYLPFIPGMMKEGAETVGTGMRHERERADEALRLAKEGKRVVVVSSGDSGIYGMASLMMEAAPEDTDITVLPGISAFQKAAALLGAPISHDFCSISLSDLMTPWETIERRIRAAAAADFVTAVYNPRSSKRYWQLYRLRELFLKTGRQPLTPVGIVKQAGREGQQVRITTLAALDPEETDMFTILIIGNSQTYTDKGRMITPRGYKKEEREERKASVGATIMTESFRAIMNELKQPDIPIGRLWPLLHVIHTTADFSMENLLLVDENAVASLYNKVRSGELTAIVTDVTMVVSGIRKGALARLGVEAICYLNDRRTEEMAREENITRAAAGIRLAVIDHPDALFAFGNSPAALMELCRLMREGKARPQGIIAAPVGFVHVRESKEMVKPFRLVPKIIIEGRKGGSGVAATLCNAILTFDDAALLRPGRDV